MDIPPIVIYLQNIAMDIPPIVIYLQNIDMDIPPIVIYLQNIDMCSDCALTLYILGISRGRWQDMYTEKVVDSVAKGRELSGLSRSGVREVGSGKLPARLRNQSGKLPVRFINRSGSETGPGNSRSRRSPVYVPAA